VAPAAILGALLVLSVAANYQENVPSALLDLVAVTALLARQRAPLAVFVVTGAAVFLAMTAHLPVITLVLPAALVALYTVDTRCSRGRSLGASAVALAGACIALGVSQHDPAATLVHTSMVPAGLILAVWVIGDNVRVRRAYVAGLEERAAWVDAQRLADARLAAEAERARIARELHDVIAHNVSVMVVQADGASYALDSSPERARQALGAIASTGRQALAEMRRMLGVLRSDDDTTGVVPLPGIEQLGELLEQTRASGLAVSFTVLGVPGPLPGGLALAAYRIIQESLTNVIRHAGPATATVSLGYEPDRLRIEIRDTGRGTPGGAHPRPGGHGLPGMRERAAAAGGELTAGPAGQGGGFAVTASLPVRRPPAAAPSPAAEGSRT